jgi:hypothetical protein
VYLRDSGMGRREGGVTENGAALSGGKQSKLWTSGCSHICILSCPGI